ncbi:LPS export ABC transporter permease LptG [Thiohalorhabdus methylotrophus]|uniref:LPS export ABC transporter permease LptG n=1 Tax=Thiohalorhabdus methylotrophus TaxID=3242694 RepID=A0ABV4TWA2_9GAMM
MKTVDRFLIGGFFARSALMLFLLTGIYLLSETLNYSGKLGEGGFGFVELLFYLAMRVPGILVEMAPFGALLGTLVLLGELARHAELTALRAGGMSLPRVARPLLLGGLVVTALTFILNDSVAGQLSYIADRYLEQQVKGRQQGRWLPGGGIWFQDGQWVVSATRVASSGSELRGVRLFRRGESGMLREMVEAERMVYEGGGWRLRKVQGISTEELVPREERDLAVPFRIQPSVLADLGKSPERMSFARLWDYVGKLKDQGQPVRGLAFSLWQKVTMPLACMIMVLVAAPFVTLNSRGGGRVGRLLAGIALGFAFHASNVLTGQLSTAGSLPPAAAAWLPILVFGTAGGVLLYRAR